MSNDNRCVACGRIIPEGRQICPLCEAGYGLPARKGKRNKNLWQKLRSLRTRIRKKS